MPHIEANGVELHYLQMGAGPDLVMLHGISGNLAVWHLRMVPLLQQHFRVTTYDLRGHGNSSMPPSGYTTRDMALDLGANMVPSIAGAIDLPLPTQLLNTTVMIGGIAAPIFFAAPNQLNVQMPEEIAGLSSVAVSLNYLNVVGNTVLLSVAPQAPGIFSLATTGKGPGAVLNQNGTLNGLTNPEHIGNTLQVYATGIGSSAPPVPTGNAAPFSPLSNSVNPPSATIDGIPAQVTFAGRSPGFVGLDQVNVVVPVGASTGRLVELVITAGSNASNAVTVVLAP